MFNVFMYPLNIHVVYFYYSCVPSYISSVIQRQIYYGTKWRT